MPDPDLNADPLLATVPVHEGYRVLGGVVLYQKLGRGGMGAVYKGRHLRLHIDVAVKVLALPGWLPPAEAESVVVRFLREARTAASVRHQNLIRVYDVNTELGVRYLIMDYVDGETAADLLERLGPSLSERAAVEIALGAADGLAAAHGKKIVHRDVKPSNILLGRDGSVVVADLGLAKAFSGDELGGPSMVTQTQTAMGTPAYMAPEQFTSARDAGPSADVWSLGVTLYHLAAGCLPWSAASIFDLANRIQNDPAPSPRESRPELSDGVSAVIAKALRKDPAERYTSCAEFSRALARHLVETGASGRRALSEIEVGAAPSGHPSAAPPAEETMTLIAEATEGKDAAAPSGRLERAAAKVGPPEGEGGAARAPTAAFDDGAPAVAEDAKMVAGPPPTLEVNLGGGIALEMIHVPPGRFMMGSKSGGDDERPVHEVLISQDFYLGRFEVTQEQYERVMSVNPSSFRGPTRPVERVPWRDAVEFCTALSERAGREFRLPTEAEWEYACRAGRGGSYCFAGDESRLGEYAWYSANSAKSTHPVGRKAPNDWGFHDMHGNVWEWCSDWYAKDFYAKSPARDPAGPPSGDAHVLRGGSWSNYEMFCRSTTRYFFAFKSNLIGFRAAAPAESR